jgi:hypothetical protein
LQVLSNRHCSRRGPCRSQLPGASPSTAQTSRKPGLRRW